MAREILHERVEVVSRKSVDRDKGLVEGMKLCGRKSKNGRWYTDKALEQLAAMYPKRQFNFDHADRPGGHRRFDDLGGMVLESRAVLTGGVDVEGVYGNTGVETSTERGRKFLEFADRFPETLGCSHDIEADVVLNKAKGIYEVVNIIGVNSVDAVDKPATNKGVFEQTGNPMKIKLNEFIEKLADNDPHKLALKAVATKAGDRELDSALTAEGALLEMCGCGGTEQRTSEGGGNGEPSADLKAIAKRLEGIESWQRRYDRDVMIREIFEANEIMERDDLRGELLRLYDDKLAAKDNKKNLQERVALWSDEVRTPTNRPFVESKRDDDYDPREGEGEVEHRAAKLHEGARLDGAKLLERITGRKAS